MDIKLNEDQVEIARQARRFCENEAPLDYVRRMYDDERGLTDEVWAKLVEMGWTALRIPEEYGGLGLTLTDLCVVLEEMGRTVFPGPYFSTVLLAAETLIEAGGEEQKAKLLAGVAEGRLKGALALAEPDGGADPGYIQMPARADGDGFVLSGAKMFVPDAHTADFIIAAARTSPGDDPASGVTLFLIEGRPPGLSVELLPTMDGSRKLCRVEFQDVRLGPEAVLGQVDQGGAPLARALGRGQVGLAAETLGFESAGHGTRLRIRQGAGPVRPAHRRVPGREARLRSDVSGSGKRAFAAVLGGLGSGTG